MYKLIILFEPPIDEQDFQDNWQKFMSLAEKLPRLKREVVSRVQETIHSTEGNPVFRMHELLFDSRDALEAAMGSPAGQAAGQFLLAFTLGRVRLMVAEHMEAYEREFQSRAG